MSVIRATVVLLVKIFAADLWLTLTALATVGVCAVGLNLHILVPGALPYMLTGGVLAALTIGAVRGSKS